LIYRRSVLALTEGDTVKANRYIKRYISIRKEQPWDEAQIAYGMANIYSEAELQDEAENYFRLAASIYQLEDPYYLNKLAYFLIDNDRNIDEGLGLVDKALELYPDNYDYLDTKGWGLYKLGKYKEALEILQKSWDIRRKKSEYDHAAFLHLEAAKRLGTKE
jgi:tetratricopeptide (TPR) repeat protein